MKMCGEEKVWLHAFLDVAVRFISGKEPKHIVES
jgi:hypothetical protein